MLSKLRSSEFEVSLITHAPFGEITVRVSSRRSDQSLYYYFTVDFTVQALQRRKTNAFFCLLVRGLFLNIYLFLFLVSGAADSSDPDHFTIFC
jgi:hypothetical protein